MSHLFGHLYPVIKRKIPTCKLGHLHVVFLTDFTKPAVEICLLGGMKEVAVRISLEFLFWLIRKSLPGTLNLFLHRVVTTW